MQTLISKIPYETQKKLLQIHYMCTEFVYGLSGWIWNCLTMLMFLDWHVVLWTRMAVLQKLPRQVSVPWCSVADSLGM